MRENQSYCAAFAVCCGTCRLGRGQSARNGADHVLPPDWWNARSGRPDMPKGARFPERLL